MLQVPIMKALRDYLETNNLQKSEFAKRIGVTPGRVSQLLNDSSEKPSLGLILKIEDVTGGAVRAQDWAAHSRGEAA